MTLESEIEKYIEKLIKIRDFYEKNKKFPSRANPKSLEEKELSKFIYLIKYRRKIQSDILYFIKQYLGSIKGTLDVSPDNAAPF